MNNLWKILVISTAVVIICPSALGQPLTGTWTTGEGDFAAGSWMELLYGGGEGLLGNEIQATNGSDFDFYGATIGSDPGDVVLTQDCAVPDFVAFMYRTYYYGGMLTLNSVLHGELLEIRTMKSA